MKTKITLIASIAFLLIFGVFGVAALGVSVARAQGALEDYPLIIQNLAQRFGLDAQEVQGVFGDTREQRVSDRLDELIEDGTITEEQKTMVLEKHEEMRTRMEEIRNEEMTADERREAMLSLREEIQEWADENDIPMEAMMLGRGGRHKGMGMEPGMGMMEGFGCE